MKTNKQSKIKVPKSGFKRARFDWAHDVNTTFSWGEVQPTQCKLIQPNSKTTMSTQSLIRLAPMVAPTFGRVKYRTYNQFVPVSDLLQNYDAMMAQEPVVRTDGKMIPSALPSVMLGQLSTWVLHGARATLYWKDPAWTGDGAVNGDYKVTYRKLKADLSALECDTEATAALQFLEDASVLTMNNSMHTSSIFNKNKIGARVILQPFKMSSTWNNAFLGDANHTSTAPSFAIVLGNTDKEQLIPIDRSYVRGGASHYAAIANLDDDINQEITFAGADYVIEFSATYQGTSRFFAIAFELSDAGKRMRKILQGAGYQINFGSSEWVSILPLVAQYKAYFDVFGLQLFQGWETTNAAILLNRLDSSFFTHLGYGHYTGYKENTYGSYHMAVMPYVGNNSGNGQAAVANLFNNFMYDLYNEFYTEAPDWIGSHMDKTAVSPEVDPSGFISVDNTNGYRPHIVNAQNGVVQGTGMDGTHENQNANTDQDYLDSPYTTEGHMYINNAIHGEVDAELLKRMYKWTNRNSILGREIAKLLRAQGLGDYVNECKSNYIGATDSLVTISDVVSMAATSDAVLGEYGGKGLQYIEDKTLVYENDALGYWVTLATIVPEAGYTQGLDPTLKCLDKFSMYNPDFDAVGMELTTKDAIVGNADLIRRASGTGPSGSFGFGFTPRYSKFKVAHNLTNGDFNRHSKRAVYLPYTLDKQIVVNDFEQSGENYQQGSGSFSTAYVQIKESINLDRLPIAGNVWRMPTKYAWLGNFNRIFYNTGKRDDDFAGTEQSINIAQLVGFTDYNDDNFLSHGIYNVQCFSPMKPIEESYGLDDMEDPNGKAGAEFVTKA